jgi:hypothetical protein
MLRENKIKCKKTTVKNIKNADFPVHSNFSFAINSKIIIIVTCTCSVQVVYVHFQKHHRCEKSCQGEET